METAKYKTALIVGAGEGLSAARTVASAGKGVAPVSCQVGAASYSSGCHIE
jgi:hypothetical protein